MTRFELAMAASPVFYEPALVRTAMLNVWSQSFSDLTLNELANDLMRMLDYSVKVSDALGPNELPVWLVRDLLRKIDR